jgi:hypothetical protein
MRISTAASHVHSLVFCSFDKEITEKPEFPEKNTGYYDCKCPPSGGTVNRIVVTTNKNK